LLLALEPFSFPLFDGTIFASDGRIANTLLANIQRNDDAYVGKEIEARHAPEGNDRFIRVTNSENRIPYYYLPRGATTIKV
jgi:hypothetical protein